MMKKIISSIMITFLTILFVGFLFSIKTDIYFNGFALLLVPVFGTIYAFTITGFKSSIKAFKIPLETFSKIEELKTVLHFFKTLEKALIVFGIFWVLINIIDMLKNLEDASQIGIRFAMSFIGLLFSIILIALFIIPYKVIIEKKIV